MTDTLYIPTPIEEKPEKVGHYIIPCDNGKGLDIRWYGIDGWEKLFPFETHWLKPVSKQEFVREIAKSAFGAGAAWSEFSGSPIDSLIPDLETYLNNL